MKQAIVGGVCVAVALLTGCQQKAEATGKVAEAGPVIHQESICEVKDWKLGVTTAQCKPGQKVIFLPSSWGNEQLPMLFVGVNCDLRYSVALTHGGVVCIFHPIKPEDSNAK